MLEIQFFNHSKHSFFSVNLLELLLPSTVKNFTYEGSANIRSLIKNKKKKEAITNIKEVEHNIFLFSHMKFHVITQVIKNSCNQCFRDIKWKYIIF